MTHTSTPTAFPPPTAQNPILPLLRVLSLLIATVLVLAGLVAVPAPAHAVGQYLENFFPMTWNMQGGTDGQDSKWTSSVWRLLRDGHDMVALQEVGPQPPGVRTARPAIQPDPGLPAVLEYQWNPGGRRGQVYWVYFMQTDPTGNRVNLAIVTTQQAQNVYVVPPGNETPDFASRPAFGVLLPNSQTVFYTVHGNSQNSGGDIPALLGLISGQAEAHNLDWAAMGDYNRSPDTLPLTGPSSRPAGSIIYATPAGPPEVSTQQSGGRLDYMVTSRAVGGDWGARRLNWMGGDHYPVDFFEHAAAAPQAGQWCADENGSCTIPSNSTVIYGNGTFEKNKTLLRNFPGPPPGSSGASVQCNNATFGDPDPGNTKHCWYVPVADDWSQATHTITNINGKCLAVQNNNSANTTPVVITDCDPLGDFGKAWNVASDGTIRAMNKCLDVAGGGTTDSTPIQLYDCNGTGAQQWKGRGDGTLVNPQSGKCLSNSGLSTTNGTQALLYPCDSSNMNADRQWRWTPNLIVSPGGQPRCLNTASAADNSDVGLVPCNASDDKQSWEFAGASVRQKDSGKCLDVYGGAIKDDSRVDLWPCNGSGAQQWTIQSDGSLMNRQSGKCLDFALDRSSQLWIDTCGVYPSDEFNLVAGTISANVNDPTNPNNNNNNCIDDKGGGGNDWDAVQQYTCNGTQAQKLSMAPDGTIHIFNNCISAYGGQTTNNTKAVLYDCDRTGSEQWWPTVDGKIFNPQSGKCLEESWPYTPWTQLQIEDCQNVARQNWNLPLAFLAVAAVNSRTFGNTGY